MSENGTEVKIPTETHLTQAQAKTKIDNIRRKLAETNKILNGGIKRDIKDLINEEKLKFKP